MKLSDEECHRHCHQKAMAFCVVQRVTDLMGQAADRMQHWESEETRTRGPDGNLDGGHEIRITIAPPGQELPATPADPASPDPSRPQE